MKKKYFDFKNAVMMFGILSCMQSYAGGDRHSGRDGAEEFASQMRGPLGFLAEEFIAFSPLSDLVGEFLDFHSFLSYRGSTGESGALARATQARLLRLHNQRLIKELLSPFSDLNDGF